MVLREKDLPRAERTALAADLRAILVDVGGTLIVAGPDPLGGDAVHLPAAGPYPPPTHQLVGRSCHNHTELRRLTTEHYATLSPVYPTRTKPGYGPPLGPGGLRKLMHNSPVPTLALGGVETPHQVTACVEAGAVGVAVLGAIMRAQDPAETATELTRAFKEAVTPKPSHSRRQPTGVPTAAPNRNQRGEMTPTTVLTIAGSDSGGGAGIQADLKVFAALGAYGTSVLTAVTAQNTRGVDAVLPLPPRTVTEQLDSVLTDFTVCAVKTGMLGTPAVADVVAEAARDGRLPQLVVDPVLVATSGHRLGVVGAVERLLPYARVATPNCAEAAAITGRPVDDVAGMVVAAEALGAGGPEYVVVTGGDLDGGEAVDVLHGDGVTTLLRAPRVATRHTHGTGCSFSAAVAVRLALGDPVPVAVGAAKEYVLRALTGARGWELGAGRGPLNHFGWSA